VYTASGAPDGVDAPLLSRLTRSGLVSAHVLLVMSEGSRRQMRPSCVVLGMMSQALLGSGSKLRSMKPQSDQDEPETIHAAAVAHAITRLD